MSIQDYACRDQCIKLHLNNTCTLDKEASNVNQSKQLGSVSGQALLDELVSGDYFSRFTTQQIGNVIYGLGRLKCQHAEVHKAVAQELSKKDRLEEMKYLELSTVFVGLGQMQFLEIDTLNLIATEVMKPTRLAGFKPLELAYILHGSGMLKYKNKRFLHALTSEVTRGNRLVGFREKELANITYALGLLDFKDEAVVSILLREITRKERLDIFTDQGLENIVFAMRKMGRGADPLLSKLVKESNNLISPAAKMSDAQLFSTVFGCGKTIDFDSVSMSLVKELLDPVRIKNYPDESLSGLLNGLHQIGYTDPLGLEMCLNEVVSRLQRVDARVLSYFAYGLRVNKVDNSEVLRMFAEEVSKPERLSAFTHQQLTGTFYALCLLGWKRADVVQTMLNEILLPSRLNECSEQGLANVVNALSFINYTPKGKQLLPLFAEIVKLNRLRDFNTHGLVCTVVATAKLKCAPRELALPPIVELCSPGRLVSLRRSEVAQVIYNLGHLRFRNKRILSAIVKELMKQDRMESFKRIELSMIIYALGLLKIRESALTSALVAQVSCAVSTMPCDSFKGR